MNIDTIVLIYKTDCNFRYLYTLHNEAPGVQQPDQTLEILMQDLDPKTMKKFFKEKDSDVKEVTKVCCTLRTDN